MTLMSIPNKGIETSAHERIGENERKNDEEGRESMLGRRSALWCIPSHPISIWMRGGGGGGGREGKGISGGLGWSALLYLTPSFFISFPPGRKNVDGVVGFSLRQ